MTKLTFSLSTALALSLIATSASVRSQNHPPGATYPDIQLTIPHNLLTGQQYSVVVAIEYPEKNFSTLDSARTQLFDNR